MSVDVGDCDLAVEDLGEVELPEDGALRSCPDDEETAGL